MIDLTAEQLMGLSEQGHWPACVVLGDRSCGNQVWQYAKNHYKEAMKIAELAHDHGYFSVDGETIAEIKNKIDVIIAIIDGDVFYCEQDWLRAKGHYGYALAKAESASILRYDPADKRTIEIIKSKIDEVTAIINDVEEDASKKKKR